MSDNSQSVTVEELAKSVNISGKKFRKALREKRLGWYRRYQRWTVERGGSKHGDMLIVLGETLKRRGA